MFLGLLAPHCLPKDLAFTSAFDFFFQVSFLKIFVYCLKKTKESTVNKILGLQILELMIMMTKTTDAGW